MSSKSSSHIEASGPSQPVDTDHTYYQKLLDDDFGRKPEYSWLLRFLNTPGPPISETYVTIFDCIGNELQHKGTFSNVTDDFQSQLRSRSNDAELRLIIMTYQNSWLVDRSMVDRLSADFDLTPDFLRRHFYYYFIYVEDGIPQDKFRYEEDDIHGVPHALMSDEDHNEFHLAATRSYHKLSAYLHKDSKTVLIWIRDATNSKDLSNDTRSESISDAEKSPLFPESQILMRRYLSLVYRMSAREISMGTSNWVYLLYPYVRDLILNFSAKSYSDKRDINTENFVSDYLVSGSDSDSVNASIDETSNHLTQIMYESGALKKLQYELKRIYSQCTVAEACRKFELLQHDAEYVNQTFERAAQYFRDAKNALLTAAQIDEAHASTDAALSVNRLSRLAFFFIPLSFTASVFGMNIIEFGQGSVPLRTFFITALVMGICTIIPLWYPILVAIQRSGSVDNIRIISRLIWYSPTLAFWYLALCVKFEHPVVMALCGKEITEILKIHPVFEYKRMDRQEARRRMHRSYYSFGSEDRWVERADGLVERLVRLKPQSDSGVKA